jgi:hypothetical protein
MNPGHYANHCVLTFPSSNLSYKTSTAALKAVALISHVSSIRLTENSCPSPLELDQRFFSDF